MAGHKKIKELIIPKNDSDNDNSVNYFIGCDCAKYSVNIVVLDNQSHLIEYKEIISKNKINSQRSKEIWKDLIDYFYFGIFGGERVKNNYNVIVGIESAIYLNNIKTTNDIQRTIVTTDLALSTDEQSCIEVDNRTWKKNVIGNGKASKEDIMQFCKTKWPGIFWVTQDMADAACIAFHMLKQYRVGEVF